MRNDTVCINFFCRVDDSVNSDDSYLLDSLLVVLFGISYRALKATKKDRALYDTRYSALRIS